MQPLVEYLSHHSSSILLLRLAPSKVGLQTQVDCCDVLKKQADWAKRFDQMSVSKQKKHLVPDRPRAHPQLKVSTSIWIKRKKSNAPQFPPRVPKRAARGIHYSNTLRHAAALGHQYKTVREGTRLHSATFPCVLTPYKFRAETTLLDI